MRKTMIFSLVFLFSIILSSCAAIKEALPHSHMDDGHHMDSSAMQGAIDSSLQSSFDRSTDGLQQEKPHSSISPRENEVVQLIATPISKTIKGNTIKMFGYNSQIPGPMIKVRQGQTIYVNLTNKIDMETTLHSHGIRIENAYDGVPGVTQDPIMPGQSFLYKITFPDAGMYWYHPHIREDYQQELGLYGNYWVLPSTDDENPVNREEVLVLDDIKLENGDLSPFSAFINHALMGRFGNTMLVNGQESYSLDVKKGEVVRFYITNVANVRPFRVSFSNAKMKIVGSDLGHYQHDFFADYVTLAPAERYIIEVLFEKEGTSKFTHKTPYYSYALGDVSVSSDSASPSHASSFNEEKQYSVSEELESLKSSVNDEPEVSWKLSINVQGMGMMRHSDKEGMEWEDSMPHMTPLTSNRTLVWQIIDMKTGKANMDSHYEFKKGDMVKIRLYNDPNTMHPMPHPIHFHGQRFVVLARNGEEQKNLVWKDTVLVPLGHTVDILLEISNPGDWMAHCHIAEHLQSGMMTHFTVD